MPVNTAALRRRLRLLRSLSIRESVRSRTFVFGAQDGIPEGEEWLGKIGLDAPRLVVDIMICGVVRGDELQGIPRECVAAVIIHGFNSRKCEEAGALSDTHSGQFESNPSTERVQQEALKRVVVQSTVGIWDVESVVSGVESSFGVQSG